MTSIDFDGINAAALRNGRYFVESLLPGGKFRSLEYVVKNPCRNDRRPGSFSINCKSGCWKDFSSDDGGADLISLMAYVRGIGQGAAAREMADKLGVPLLKSNGSAKPNGSHTNGHHHERSNGTEAPQVYPWGNEGPPVRPDEIRRHAYSCDGRAMRVKVKLRDGGFINWYRVFSNGVPIGWKAKKPDDYEPIPYVTSALDPFVSELIADEILWPEGEKDVDTLNKLNLPAFTFGGVGDGMPDGIEFYLKNRRLVILADNDDAGRNHADKKAVLAHEAGAASIKVFHFPELPPKGDVSDFIANGGTAEQLTARIDATAEWSLPDARAEWPCIDHVAFHGLAGEVVRTIGPHSEADSNGLLLQFLAAFGNAVGAEPYYLVEGDQHRAKLYLLLCGATSKGRKGTGLSRIRQLMRVADKTWESDNIKTGLSSGEGVIYHVRDSEKEDTGVSDKRLMLVVEEFAGALSVMERPGNTLSPVLRDAWGMSKLQTLTKNAPIKATNSHVSLIGHITDQELRAVLSRTEMANGFANRIMFARVKRARFLPHGGHLDDQALSDLAARVSNSLGKGQRIGRVTMTNPAARAWEENYEELSAERSGLIGAILGRAEAQVVRLALIYALIDGQAQIDLPHIAAAFAVWTYCEDSAKQIFGDLIGDSVADEILGALKAAGASGLARTEIANLFSRHQSSARISSALSLLERLGKAERMKSGGHGEERWASKGASN